jgi:dihydrofolate synthase/folylpolyglutamate synthase
LPKNAHYIFCQADIPRALDAMELAKKAGELGLKCDIVRDVNEAILMARKKAGKEDFIFIGGSTFVVAEINDL